jgi:hypothetical protein
MLGGEGGSAMKLIVTVADRCSRFVCGSPSSIFGAIGSPHIERRITEAAA